MRGSCARNRDILGSTLVLTKQRRHDNAGASWRKPRRWSWVASIDREGGSASPPRWAFFRFPSRNPGSSTYPCASRARAATPTGVTGGAPETTGFVLEEWVYPALTRYLAPEPTGG